MVSVAEGQNVVVTGICSRDAFPCELYSVSTVLHRTVASRRSTSLSTSHLWREKPNKNTANNIVVTSECG